MSDSERIDTLVDNLKELAQLTKALAEVVDKQDKQIVKLSKQVAHSINIGEITDAEWSF